MSRQAPPISAATFAVSAAFPLARRETSMTGRWLDGTSDGLLCQHVVVAVEIGAPATETGDVRASRQALALTEETLDERTVSKGHGADAERSRHASDEVAEALLGQRPDFEFDSVPTT